jgi:hypothetical protein
MGSFGGSVDMELDEKEEGGTVVAKNSSLACSEDEEDEEDEDDLERNQRTVVHGEPMSFPPSNPERMHSLIMSSVEVRLKSPITLNPSSIERIVRSLLEENIHHLTVGEEVEDWQETILGRNVERIYVAEAGEHFYPLNRIQKEDSGTNTGEKMT